jgi:hypothetical protein
MVWCDLDSLTSLGRFTRSSGRAHSAAETEEGTMKEKGRKGLGRKLKSDSHGPYVEGKSPRIAHYALRVRFVFNACRSSFASSNSRYQLEPGKGDHKNIETWQYLGLSREGKQCFFSEDKFDCPDGRDKLWDHHTTRSIKNIKNIGQSTRPQNIFLNPFETDPTTSKRADQDRWRICPPQQQLPKFRSGFTRLD